MIKMSNPPFAAAPQTPNARNYRNLFRPCDRLHFIPPSSYDRRPLPPCPDLEVVAQRLISFDLNNTPSSNQASLRAFESRRTIRKKTRKITMPSQQTYRMTLFKIPRAEDQDKLLEMYKAMPEKALKVGRSVRLSAQHKNQTPTLTHPPTLTEYPFPKLTRALCLPRRTALATSCR